MSDYIDGGQLQVMWGEGQASPSSWSVSLHLGACKGNSCGMLNFE